jgi:hypothetical protein
MGAVCNSVKNKNIKGNQKDKDNKEEENNKDKKDSKDENKEKEGNDAQKSKDDENKEKNSSSKTEKENNKGNKEQEEKGDAKVFPEITFKIENKDQEYTEKVKSSEKISYLFTLISKYKKKKYSEYDLITDEEDEDGHISLSSKLNDEIGLVFPNKETVVLKMLYLGLEISLDVKNDYEVTTTLVGEPLFDLGGNVGLLIFHKYEHSFTSEILKNQKLSKYNHLSSYCNCKNVLYICGGESQENKGTNNRNYISDFTQVDLFNTESINELPNLEEPRAWHSMIFIPNKYIFIVGGDTRVVEIFDIEKKKLSPDSEMNEIRNECTLFCLNDSILYAFSGVAKNGNYLKNIEKCNLRHGKREWTLIECNEKSADFQDCFYISCFNNKSSIILFAANENENYSYDSLIFEVKEDENNAEEEEDHSLKVFNTEEKLIDVCPEKMFHPISNNSSVLIPLTGNTVTLYSVSSDMKLEKKLFPDALKKIFD